MSTTMQGFQFCTNSDSSRPSDANKTMMLFGNISDYNYNKPDMKKHLPIVFLIILIPAVLSGQDKKSVETFTETEHLLGIGLKSKNRFSFLFKIKKESHALRFEAFTMDGVWEKKRHNTIYSGIDTMPVIHSWDRHIGFGGNLGLEWNNSFVKNIRFIHGPFVSGYFYYEYSKIAYLFDAREEWDFRLGLGYLVVINYRINEYFGLSAELMPQLGYRWKRYFSNDQYPDREIGKDGRAKSSDLKFQIRNEIQISVFYIF
jgi:hypothetical protein